MNETSREAVSLDEAWERAEKALPDGWRLLVWGNSEDYRDYGALGVEKVHGIEQIGVMGGFATPAAALVALAEKLEAREHTTTRPGPDPVHKRPSSGRIEKRTFPVPTLRSTSRDSEVREAIEALRSLSDAATPGPWEAHPDGLVWRTDDAPGDPVSGSTEPEDARLIAAAVNALRRIFDAPSSVSEEPRTPTRKWPTTREGQDMLDHSVQYVPEDADRRVVAAKIAAIEAEAAQGALDEAGLQPFGPKEAALRNIAYLAIAVVDDWIGDPDHGFILDRLALPVDEYRLAILSAEAEGKP